MTGNGKAISSTAANNISEPSRRIIVEKSIKFGLPVLLCLLLIVVYSLALNSPGLLDEQYLLAWLKAMPKLHGSAGLYGFLSFPGLDPVDAWGITTKLFLLFWAMLLGKNMALLKFMSLTMHGACTYLTYLCCKNICAGRVPSTIAALLFAFYPLHFEATAWLGGIGSELSTFFFFSSLFIYLQGRQSGLGWGKIALVNIAMLLAVTSSSLIWTGCLAFGLFELVDCLLADKKAERRDLTMRLISVLMPVLVVGACLAATGGIAAGCAPGLAFKNILSCLRHLFLPVNEINWKRYSKEYLQLYALYPFLGLSFVTGLLQSRDLKRASLYSFLLFALLALPAVGLSCLQSDLYGERWLYPCSVPLCIFLACCVSGFSNLKGNLKLAGNAGTTVLALALCLFFFRHLWNENAANRNFARILKTAQKSMKITHEKEHLSIFIVRDLPEKISVCPLYSPRGPVLFDAESGLLRSNAVPDGRLKELLREGKLRESCMRYDDSLKSLLPLDLGPDRSLFPENLNAELFSGRMEPAVGFYKNVRLSADRSELLLESNSENGPVITIDPGEISTVDGDYLYLEAIIDAPSSFCAPRIELYWQTRLHQNYEKRERFSYADAIVNDGKMHRYLLSLRRNGWTTGGVPTIAAIGFPAGSRVRLEGAGLLRSGKNMLPRVTPLTQASDDPNATRFTPPYYNYPVDSQLGMIALSPTAQALEANYSAAELPAASGVLVELSFPDRSFDDANSNHLSGQTYKTFVQKGTEGRFSIPISELPGSGVYSLRVIARDASGNNLGQFSNPLCFQVPRVRKEN